MEVRRSTTEWLESLADRLGVTAWSLGVGAIAIAVAGLGGWWAFAAPAPPPAEEVLPRVGTVAPIVASPGDPVSVRGNIVVHVDGAVVRPGVHELLDGARVVDAIEAAGGLRDDADRARLNLAAVVGDGQRVWVPLIGEDEPPVAALTGGDALGPDGEGAINLNTADLAALETLPGIGPSIAAAIIRHRETEGLYQRIEDLAEVAGIGPSRLAQLEALVTV